MIICLNNKMSSSVNSTIQGLTIIPEFITQEYEQELIRHILSEPWNTALLRRTQHYGYQYNYKMQRVIRDDYLGPFPAWLDKLIDNISEHIYLEYRPDQVIINEYLPGQGISPHTDAKDIFGDVICSLSLGSDIIMTYSKDKEKIDFLLKCRSFLVMTNEARYKWLHSIAPRKTNVINGERYPRTTRYSITFRKMVGICG